jgi:prepilin-type N-terminal cleavage/methylation domain-containing protein
MLHLPIIPLEGGWCVHKPLNGQKGESRGFTLVELVAVVAVIGVVSAIAIPKFNFYYESSCVQAAVSEITGMIEDAKRNALCDCRDYGVGFDTASGKISLISDKGRDDKWNTADDKVVRSIRLVDKRGGLSFSFGTRGHAPGCDAVPPDGVSFNSNNTIVCNERLTGNAGAVYISSRSGAAMALVMNSEDYGWKLYKWNGKKWVRL